MRPAFNEHNWIGDVGTGRPRFIEVISLLLKLTLVYGEAPLTTLIQYTLINIEYYRTL